MNFIPQKNIILNDSLILENSYTIHVNFVLFLRVSTGKK